MLARVESLQLLAASNYSRNVSGHPATVLYFDSDPEFMKIRKLSGTCLRLRKRGINSKVTLLSSGSRAITFSQTFFINGPHFLGLRIEKRRFK